MDGQESRRPGTLAGGIELHQEVDSEASRPNRSSDKTTSVTVVDRLWKAALDVVFPIDCLGCGSRGRFVCPSCVDRMPKLERPFCTVCANPGVAGICSWCQAHAPSIDAIRSPYLYVPSSPIYRAITSLKYGGMRSIAPELAELLYAFWGTRRTADPDIIVPVPSHPSRVRQRGYSQASLIAAELGRRMNVSVSTDTLLRVKNAPSQLETESREDRWSNVQGGFRSRSHVDGARVLLVDDLVTTGSTASACAAALKMAGAHRVVGLSLARAP